MNGTPHRQARLRLSSPRIKRSGVLHISASHSVCGRNGSSVSLNIGFSDGLFSSRALLYALLNESNPAPCASRTFTGQPAFLENV